MKKKPKNKLDQCATDLAAISQAHLAKLPAAEREKRLRAFERAVAKITGDSSDTREGTAEGGQTRAYPVHARGR